MEEPMLVKKEKLTDRLMKKKNKVLIIAVFFILTIVIGSSYALLTNFDQTEEVITISTGNLTMTINNVLVDLNNKLPESDANGLTNASPVTVTVTNTGTMNIMKYELKLLNDSTQTSTLPYNYIKFAISEDGTNYSEPKNLGSVNNIIFTGYNLAVESSKTIYLKAWVDESAGNAALNKTFYGSVTAVLYQKAEIPKTYEDILEQIDARANDGSNCQTKVVEDGITYISGNKECINFNYVWWSGKMWRITAIYPDGAMKLITDNNLTSISFAQPATGVYYNKANGNKTNIYEWLNEDFLDTLYNQGSDVIDTTKSWNATMPSNATISTKPLETDATMIPTTISPVGLLNSYEYYKSYQNATAKSGYLNIGYYWWMLTPYYNTTNSVWGTDYEGNGISVATGYMRGVRPSIIIKSGISMIGAGTNENPYRLLNDFPNSNVNDLINTRHSGEYVKLKNNESEQLFRIVDTENNKTKIVAMDYADNGALRKFATNSSDIIWGSGTTTGTDTWYTYLNNTYYPNLVSTYGELFDSAIYYFGDITNNDQYKLSICANTTSGNTKICDKTTQNGTLVIGLLRHGEMFSTVQGNGSSSSTTIYLINPRKADSICGIYYTGQGYNNLSNETLGARPTVHLKSTVKILSGSGTELDPYIVS